MKGANLDCRVLWSLRMWTGAGEDGSEMLEWRQLWWGALIIGLCGPGELDAEGRPLWKVVYDPLPPEWRGEIRPAEAHPNNPSRSMSMQPRVLGMVLF